MCCINVILVQIVTSVHKQNNAIDILLENSVLATKFNKIRIATRVVHRSCVYLKCHNHW